MAQRRAFCLRSLGLALLLALGLATSVAAARSSAALETKIAAKVHHRGDQSTIASPTLSLDDDADDTPEEAKRMIELAAAAGPRGWGGRLQEDNSSFCHDRAYRKRTLKLVKEMPFIGLFHDLQKQRRFEGSGLAYAKGAYWVIFDSLRAIGKVDPHLNYRGNENKLVGIADEADSQFEGITYSEDTDSFIIVRESFTPDDGLTLTPLTEEIRIDKDEEGFRSLRKCPVAFQLEDTNKGFESIHHFHSKGESFIMGMCESNYCKTIVGPDAPGLQRGNGRIVISKLVTGVKLESPVDGHKFPVGPLKTEKSADKTECVWEFVKQITVPESAYFLDFAGLAFKGTGSGRRMAIVSQEDAAIWVGHFNWETLEFEGGGKMYHLPRDNQCGKIYCNVEGINFVDDERIILTSDASKPSVQPYQCGPKDQSVHVFGIP